MGHGHLSPCLLAPGSPLRTTLVASVAPPSARRQLPRLPDNSFSVTKSLLSQGPDTGILTWLD